MGGGRLEHIVNNDPKKSSQPCGCDPGCYHSCEGFPGCAYGRSLISSATGPAFVVKDSGKHKQFESGMVRDVTTDKIDYERVFRGPMIDRYAAHLTKGADKYADDPDGTPNWMKAAGHEELIRFRKSAVRHFRQWLRGDADEDHASAVYFNINGAEYVKGRLDENRSK